MDIASLQPSRIVAVALTACARPDTEFLCFGESGRPGPAGAVAAALAPRHPLAVMPTQRHTGQAR